MMDGARKKMRMTLEIMKCLRTKDPMNQAYLLMIYLRAYIYYYWKYIVA
jgi:hypothetical protein